MARSIRILQISDLHSAKGRAEPSDKNLSASKEPSRYSKLLEKLKSALEVIPDIAGIDYLVLNGDYIDAGQVRHHAYFADAFLKPLKEYRLFSSCKILAVPGNHDVNRESPPEEQLLELRTALRNMVMIHEPQQANTFVHSSKDGFPLEFWLANSASISGIPDPNLRDALIDPGYVARSEMDACAANLSSESLKIAIVHHNPLPFHGEGVSGEELRRYRFTNDGDFNRFLFSKKFKIALHGHQHQSRVVYFSSPPTQGSVSGCDSLSILEHGFLCIGAPSLGADLDDWGFNVIQIASGRTTSLAEVDVRQYLSGKLVGQFRHYVPLVNLESARRNCFFQAMGTMYGKDEAKFRQIREVFRPASETRLKTERAFFRDLRNMRTRIAEIRAIYSLTVFEPNKWGAKRLGSFHLPEGTRNIARALHMGRSSDGDSSARPELHFRFSKPLFRGISTARAHSKELCVGSKVWEAWRSLAEPLRSNLERLGLGREFINLCFRGDSQWEPVGNSDSLSIWDNTGSIDSSHIGNLPRVGALPVKVVDTGFRPSHNYGDPKDRERTESLMEFPRILLWDVEEFKKETAIECIMFHEECGFPLFWLDPERLRGLTGALRKLVGSLCIFPLQNNDDGLLTPNYEAFEMWNDPEGNPPAESEGVFSSRIRTIWGDGLPMRLLRSSKLIGEFLLLLERPDILFAADVWAMAMLGDESWKEVVAQLEQTDDDCKQWLEEKP